jgi:hypothetical protein
MRLDDINPSIFFCYHFRIPDKKISGNQVVVVAARVVSGIRLTRGPQPGDRKWDGRPGGLDEKLHGNKLEFGEKRQNAGREGD